MDKKLVAKELLKVAKSLLAVGALDKQFILLVDIDALPTEGDPLQEVSHALMIASRQIKSTGFSDMKHNLIDDNGKKIGYYHARQKPIKGASQKNVAAEEVEAEKDVDGGVSLLNLRRRGDGEDMAVEAEKDVDGGKKKTGR